MKIGVVGCGSLGGVIAGRLWAAHGDDVRVFERKADIVDAVRSRGLEVVDGRKTLLAHPVVLEGPSPAGPGRASDLLDCIILTTKTTALARAVEAFMPALSEHGFFVTVQNGLAALDLLEKHGRERIVSGCVMWGATLAAPGRCVVTARGPFVVGSAGGPDSPAAAVLRDALEPVFPVQVSADMRDVLWAKLTVTASLTSLGAVTGLRFGPMLQSRVIRDLILRIGTEVVEVGRASGVAFRHREGVMNVDLLAGGRTPLWLKHLIVRAIGLKHRRTESSMYASIREGAPTEIDFINGAVIRIGGEHGVATPVNQAVVYVVKEIEGGSRAPGAQSLERLCSLLKE